MVNDNFLLMYLIWLAIGIIIKYIIKKQITKTPHLYWGVFYNLNYGKRQFTVFEEYYSSQLLTIIIKNIQKSSILSKKKIWFWVSNIYSQTMNNIEKIKEYISNLWVVNVVNESLMLQAFTHKTYSKDFVNDQPPHNERLEFLGDSVLGMVVNERIYTDFSDFAESDMTLMKISMVRMEALAQIAKDIWLDDMILLGNGEEKKWWRSSEAIISDCLEWLIWYIYIDQWFEFVKRWINKYIYNPNIVLNDIKSYKAKLQELIQSKYKKLPIYIDTEHEKNDADNYVLYKSFCYINDELFGEWFGTNKKKAQEEAAKIAYEKHI